MSYFLNVDFEDIDRCNLIDILDVYRKSYRLRPNQGYV